MALRVGKIPSANNYKLWGIKGHAEAVVKSDSTLKSGYLISPLKRGPIYFELKPKVS